MFLVFGGLKSTPNSDPVSFIIFFLEAFFRSLLQSFSVRKIILPPFGLNDLAGRQVGRLSAQPVIWLASYPADRIHGNHGKHGIHGIHGFHEWESMDSILFQILHGLHGPCNSINSRETIVSIDSMDALNSMESMEAIGSMDPMESMEFHGTHGIHGISWNPWEQSNPSNAGQPMTVPSSHWVSFNFVYCILRAEFPLNRFLVSYCECHVEFYSSRFLY